MRKIAERHRISTDFWGISVSFVFAVHAVTSCQVEFLDTSAPYSFCTKSAVVPPLAADVLTVHPPSGTL